MANIEIKIDDDYFESMGQLYADWYSDLQNGINKYIQIMEAILADAIMEGETADALETFVGYAKTLNGIIEPLGTECKGLCVNFIGEVDQADNELY